MVPVVQLPRHKKKKSLKRTAKWTYEEKEQDFDTHQLDTSQADDSTSNSQRIDVGKNNENSSGIAQNISVTATVTTAATISATQGTLQFLLPASLKLLIEMRGTY